MSKRRLPFFKNCRSERNIIGSLSVAFLFWTIKKTVACAGGETSVNVLLQVETYGSMEKKEKVEFILEQMRLCIAVKDYIRTQIISKKINTKFFQEEGTEVCDTKCVCV